jgi:hypothetical protein
MDQRFGNLRLQRGTVRYQQRAYTLEDVSATMRQLPSPTAHRRAHSALLTNPLLGKLSLRKLLPSRSERGQNVLTIGGPAFEWIVPIPGRRVAAARDFADQVNSAAHEYRASHGASAPLVSDTPLVSDAVAEIVPSIVEHAFETDHDHRHARRSR